MLGLDSTDNKYCHGMKLVQARGNECFDQGARRSHEPNLIVTRAALKKAGISLFDRTVDVCVPASQWVLPVRTIRRVVATGGVDARAKQCAPWNWSSAQDRCHRRRVQWLIQISIQ